MREKGEGLYRHSKSQALHPEAIPKNELLNWEEKGETPRKTFIKRRWQRRESSPRRGGERQESGKSKTPTDEREISYRSSLHVLRGRLR